MTGDRGLVSSLTQRDSSGREKGGKKGPKGALWGGGGGGGEKKSE